MQICSTSLSASRLQRGKPWRSVEAVQARRLDHPGIVRTYKTTTVLVQVAISLLPTAEAHCYTSLTASCARPNFVAQQYAANHITCDGSSNQSGAGSIQGCVRPLNAWTASHVCTLTDLMARQSVGICSITVRRD